MSCAEPVCKLSASAIHASIRQVWSAIHLRQPSPCWSEAACDCDGDKTANVSISLHCHRKLCVTVWRRVLAGSKNEIIGLNFRDFSLISTILGVTFLAGNHYRNRSQCECHDCSLDFRSAVPFNFSIIRYLATGTLFPIKRIHRQINNKTKQKKSGLRCCHVMPIIYSLYRLYSRFHTVLASDCFS